ncbi:MAG: hypothetical protein ACLFVU_13565 [Phycisphaerae bacterium]
MSFIPFDQLSNPVLSFEDYSAKDACVIFRDGEFHLFTSIFDQQISRVAHVSSPDWIHWSEIHTIFSGEPVGAVGLCSPAVWEAADGRVLLAFNTWGQPRKTPNQPYYVETRDMKNWSAMKPIAHELTEGSRCIDVALAEHGDKWFAIWKERGMARIAWADDLDGPWEFVCNGPVKMLRREGFDVAELGKTHENCQFLMIDGVWHLLSTDYDPHDAWLYRLDGDPDKPGAWAEWTDGFWLEMKAEEFNSLPADHPDIQAGKIDRALYPVPGLPGRLAMVDGLSNAPFLCDWREQDGHFYLLYAGKNHERANEFRGTGDATVTGKGWPRGWNRLALARSKDLLNWEVPGR